MEGEKLTDKEKTSTNGKFGVYIYRKRQIAEREKIMETYRKINRITLN